MTEMVALLSRGEWLSLEDVIAQIIVDSAEAEPAIAFAISGGGATGAYEAGVLDAWSHVVASKYPQHGFLKPRFILGSSAGALNAVTTLTTSLRPGAGDRFGFEIWRALCPRAAPFIVGAGRSGLIDLATRWIKIGGPPGRSHRVPQQIAFLVVVAAFVLFSISAGVAGIARHPVPAGVLCAVVGSAIVVVLRRVFHRAVFWNRALAQTIACVLGASVDPKTSRVPPDALRVRSVDPAQAGTTFANLWYAAQAVFGPQGGGAANLRPNFIVTTTDLTTGGPNLFTLVDPGVFQRLSARGWQVMQVMDPKRLCPGYLGPSALCGWVGSDDFITCVVASTSIPGVFPSQRLTLHELGGSSTTDHDFVDGGVLNNTPIDIALDAGATHIISFELEPLSRHGAFRYVAEGVPPSLGRNLIQTFETLLSNSTRKGIEMASSWNRELVSDKSSKPVEKRLVPIFRMAPRRRELNLIDFDGHYESAFAKSSPSLEQWLTRGFEDASHERLFWNATFQPDP